MRIHLSGLILLAGLSAPAPAQAQQPQSVERRVDRLEQQLRAVQRRVFPNGNVQPEIGDQPAPPGPAATRPAAMR